VSNGKKKWKYLILPLEIACFEIQLIGKKAESYLFYTKNLTFVSALFILYSITYLKKLFSI